jgi:sec-independent protein translocase protein TatB
MFEFGVGYSELFVLAIIAVIVVGPKDLPVVLRKFGQIMAKVRGMAREFQGHVDVAMKDAGLGDIKAELQNMKSTVNSSMATPMATKSTFPTAKINSEFDKYFGAAAPAGETRVAGILTSPETAPST